MQNEQTRPTAPPGGPCGDLRHHLARDGEQCPGATMTFEEKLEVADYLDAMGVDIIEAKFPIASEGDFEAVSTISTRVKNAVVAEASRAPPRRTSTGPAKRCGTPSAGASRVHPRPAPCT